MLTSDRHNQILKIVNSNGSATVADLTEKFSASESTIRRDLIFLDNEGKLKKVHGGANAINDSFSAVEYDMDTKSALNIEQKAIIGKYAATLINDDDLVFIDAGSSTMQLVENILPSKAVFVTNGVAHAKKLIKKGLKVHVIGGELKLSTEAIIGIEAVSNVEKFNFTKAFLGTNGVSYMLPFVIGGGIMIAIAFLIDTIAGAPADSTFGTYTAAASFFKNIGGVAFNFMLPVLAGYIAMSIADRPGLVVGFVGGSIATLGSTFASPAGDASAVSGFLGALIAGFVGGYIVVLLKIASSVLPKSLEGIKPVFIYPMFGT